MQFIEDEEALGLPCPAEPDVAPSVPSQPFPLLKLPREIRNSIYYYALMRPKSTVTPIHICYMHHRVSARSPIAFYSYWGTEKSTRLFRVNRQVSEEAFETFYSSFLFHFPQSTDVALVNATLRDTLSARARSLIRSIGFMIILSSTRGAFTHSNEETYEETRRQVLEAVVKLLPNVRRFELTLAFFGLEVPDYQVKEVVARVLRIASPLRDITGLVLQGSKDDSAQRTRIIREVCEALGCLRVS